MERIFSAFRNELEATEKRRFFVEEDENLFQNAAVFGFFSKCA